MGKKYVKEGNVKAKSNNKKYQGQEYHLPNVLFSFLFSLENIFKDFEPNGDTASEWIPVESQFEYTRSSTRWIPGHTSTLIW